MGKNTKKIKASDNKPSSYYKYILIGVVTLVMGYLIYSTFIETDEISQNKNVVIDPKERIKNIREPQFKKEGELEFLKKDGKTTVKKIEIEVAEDDNERSQGLMYRRSMNDEKGMLFIFQQEEPQGFWMKNTVIPLDIIYVNSKKEIVKIFKNTTPFSESTLPSGKPAIYVVEVAGGFTEKYGIHEGDLISFKKL